MADFDPYSEWLHIPVGKRPPAASTLLGLGPAETDRDRINRAAADAYEKIRPYAASPNPEIAAHGQRILGEISRALIAFLDQADFLANSRRAAADLAAAAPWPEPEARPWQRPSLPAADLTTAVVQPETPTSQPTAYGIIAAIALGVGFLAGMAVAAMAQGRIGPVTAERDRLAAENTNLGIGINRLRKEVERLKDEADTLDPKRIETVIAERDGLAAVEQRMTSENETLRGEVGRLKDEAGTLDPKWELALDRGPDRGVVLPNGKRAALFFAGHQGTRETEAFRVDGARWRIDWTVRGGPGVGQITVLNAEGKRLTTFDVDGDAFRFMHGHGTFRLRLFIAGVDGFMVARVPGAEMMNWSSGAPLR